MPDILLGPKSGRFFRLISNLTGIAPVFFLFVFILQSSAQDINQAEIGKFRLYKFEQPIGEETYEITREADSLLIKSNFNFVDRGTAVPLIATLCTKTDLTPQTFEIKGNVARGDSIDKTVSINNGTATITEAKGTRQAAVPAHFFTIAGYAPTAMQMMLMRYLINNKIKGPLTTLPRGEITIEKRGIDRIKIDDRSVGLTRFSINGLIWGRETLWLDEQNKLAAVIGVDAEFDHFESLREGFESALPFFVAKAAGDGMEALANISGQFSPAQKGSLVITNVNLIDGTGAAPKPNMVIVIENGKIKMIGPAATVKIPKGVKVFDAGGKYALPGLWDMHAHLSQVEGGPAYLAAGVTTIRDVGNEFEFIIAVRDAIKENRGLGPQILTAGLVDGDGPEALGVNRINTAEEARRVVNRYHDAGFQQIKIYDSIKPAIVSEITAEAHRLGMTVTGHVPVGMNAIQGVEAGMDQINHIRFFSPVFIPKGFIRQPEIVPAIDFNAPEAQAALKFFKDHHTVIDPTMSLYEMILVRSTNGVSPEQVAIRRASWGYFLNIARAIHHAGLTMVIGTDSAPGRAIYRDLEIFVEVGYTPLEAIQAATIVSARAMKMDQDSGTIETGKNADLILTDGNPLDNISNIRNTKYVVTNGRLYDCDELAKSVNLKP